MFVLSVLGSPKLLYPVVSVSIGSPPAAGIRVVYGEPSTLYVLT